MGTMGKGRASRLNRSHPASSVSLLDPAWLPGGVVTLGANGGNRWQRVCALRRRFGFPGRDRLPACATAGLHGQRSDRCCRSSSCARRSPWRAKSCRTRTVGRRMSTSAFDEAAHRPAVAENGAVVRGWDAAAIAGVLQGAKHDPIVLGEHCERYPATWPWPVERLLAAGLGGPYELALGPVAYTRVLETSETAATHSSTTFARFSAVRWSGARGPGRRRVDHARR
jgi:hypothetical protein